MPAPPHVRPPVDVEAHRLGARRSGSDVAVGLDERTAPGTPLLDRLSAADLRADDEPMGKKKPGPRAGQAKRRTFTAAYKLAIVEEYERLTEPGAKGALLECDTSG